MDRNSELDANSGVTSVLLGFATQDAPEDPISHLGGTPSWFGTAPPPSTLSCHSCHASLTLLLQLNANLPSRFHDRERRLYVFVCRSRVCQRKNGSIRVLRATRFVDSPAGSGSSANPGSQGPCRTGNRVFSMERASMTNESNPFSTDHSSERQGGLTDLLLCSSATLDQSKASKQSGPQEQTTLGFAEMVKLSIPQENNMKMSTPSLKPAETQSYPLCYLEADYEHLDESPATSSELEMSAKFNLDLYSERLQEGGDEGFESTMDEGFQRFADRLSQNPEQVLRYEFSGLPLLYTRFDAAGQLLSRNDKVGFSSQQVGFPICPRCGSQRVFEFQITPHAIAVVEAEEVSMDSMAWGTLIVAVCDNDCVNRVAGVNIFYTEEWVGVQWEEDKRA